MEPNTWGLSGRPCDWGEKTGLEELLAAILMVFSRERTPHQMLSSIAYLDQCTLIAVHGWNLKTHEDFIDLILSVKHNATISRQKLVEKLNEAHSSWRSPAGDSADRALEIAIRAWLMVDIEEWTATQTLQEFLHHIFPKRERERERQSWTFRVLEFNGYNLEKIGGFDIIWTEFIQEHLPLSSKQNRKGAQDFPPGIFPPKSSAQ